MTTTAHLKQIETVFQNISDMCFTALEDCGSPPLIPPGVLALGSSLSSQSPAFGHVSHVCFVEDPAMPMERYLHNFT